MAYRTFTLTQFNEILRMVQAGFSNRKIGQALHCRRSHIVEIRESAANQSLEDKTPQFFQLENAWIQKGDRSVIDHSLCESFPIQRGLGDNIGCISASTFGKYAPRPIRAKQHYAYSRLTKRYKFGAMEWTPQHHKMIIQNSFGIFGDAVAGGNNQPPPRFTLSGEVRIICLHPDCTVEVDGNFYSAPHIHRHKRLRIKLSSKQIEILLGLEVLARHKRVLNRGGERIVLSEHLPRNSEAYFEATPQLILTQARFIHIELYRLLCELFQDDTLGNLRRAQGLIRKSFATVEAYGRKDASPWIGATIAQMRRLGNFKVRTFEAIVKAEMHKATETMGNGASILISNFYGHENGMPPYAGAGRNE